MPLARREWDRPIVAPLLKSQGMQGNQQPVVLSRWQRQRTTASGVSSSLQRAFDRLVHFTTRHTVPPQQARWGKSRTSSVRPTDNKTAREREALALAWQHRRGTRTHTLNTELDLLSLFEWVTAAVEELERSQPYAHLRTGALGSIARLCKSPRKRSCNFSRRQRALP
jgi:hypothetical protein